MKILPFMIRLLRNLFYPLETASLISIFFLWIIGLILLALFNATSALGLGASLLALTYAIVSMLVYMNLLVEYCMDVLESTTRGHEAPPVMKTSTVHHLIGSMITMGRRRFIKQALMITFYLGLVNELNKAGMIIPAVILNTVFLLLLPASFGMNAIYSNFIDLINPFKMLRFVYDLGSSYIPIALMFAIGSILFWFTLLTGYTGVLALLPLALYVLILTFRMMGKVIQHDYPRFFPQPDFHAYKKQLQEVSDINQDFNRCMKAAFQNIRDHRLEEAILAVIKFSENAQWQNFENVFNCTRDWPNKAPCLELVKHYLATPLARQNPVRAMELCHWALGQDQQFFIRDFNTMQWLARECFTTEQLRDGVNMMENYILQESDKEHRKTILDLARDLAESRLKDRALYERLMQVTL